MIKVTETEGSLEIADLMQPGMRVLFLLLALFPLLAPYQLIIVPDWQHYFNLPFLFVAVISAGALALTGFLAWAGIAGLSSYMRFDKQHGTFAYAYQAPIVRLRKLTFPLEMVGVVTVYVEDSSDGSPSYSLQVDLSDGQAFKIATSWSRQETEALQRRVAIFLGRTF
jgi:hypothetical protein